MAGQSNEGGQELELEKELSCSICTDVLYRPLTLLDCLHTFCGSCLRAWFAWQASSRSAGRGYTCPACRAAVRDTRPNATLTTLLDMFLAAHPERGKTHQEKLDMDQTYKPGDNVMPLAGADSPPDQDDEREQRLLEQARALSLNDVGLPTPSSHRSRRRHSHRPRRHGDSPQSDLLSHQSSLRSLLSASDLDSADMEDEIMRHIIDQGLLDDLDLNNLTPAQEDQITDSIAHAFRSRRSRDRRNRNPHAHRHSQSSSSHHDSSPASTNRHSPATSIHRRPASTQLQSHPVPPNQSHPISSRRRAASANHSQRLYPTAGHHQLLAPDASSRPSNHSSPALPISPRQALSSEVSAPSIKCSRCEQSDIQYSLHYNCPKCLNGDFNLCLGCYRAAKGCLNWYGFGHTALARYRPFAASDPDPSDRDPPHVLSARRYRQDTDHLDQGLFCEGCFSHANACYWHCDVCNDGAWGFCNACVQQGKHCTHPLASVAHVSVAPSSARQLPQSPSTQARDLYPPPLNLANSAFHFAVPSALIPILPHIPDPSQYALMPLASYCDLCHYSIPPSHARFHCNICNEGNYDICTSCYHSLVNTGKISQENGPSGWRRCLRAHRMSVVGHEDREGGSKRIVVKEMVGGWALKEDNAATQSSSQPKDQWRWRESDGTPASQPSKRTVSPNRLPPDGGVGLRAQAMWSYFPTENVRDELTFPRNAIVSEAEDINGDWYWGVYAGCKGLFPGNYVRII